MRDANVAAEQVRFTDEGQYWHEFVLPCLIECPRCACYAETVRGVFGEEKAPSWRIVCGKCGYSRTSDHGLMPLPPGGAAIDPVFGERLWLQVGCCGEALWAFGPRHLDFLERYVSATLREALGVDGIGPRNASLASRLPRWMIDGKNREEVLRGIAKLRERVAAD